VVVDVGNRAGYAAKHAHADKHFSPTALAFATAMATAAVCVRYFGLLFYDAIVGDAVGALHFVDVGGAGKLEVDLDLYVCVIQVNKGRFGSVCV
jgi:hypothetical protein